jgi:hypothetical protein
MPGECLRQQVEDQPDAAARVELAVRDQPDGHGEGVELREHALELGSDHRDVLGQGCDAEAVPDELHDHRAARRRDLEVVRRERQAERVPLGQEPLGLLGPDEVRQVMAGVVNGVQVTDGLMLIGGIMIAVPLLIIPLTQFLSFKANRLANLLIGVLHLVITIGVNRAPDLDNAFFAVIEIAALLLILRLAWNWKDASQTVLPDPTG